MSRFHAFCAALLGTALALLAATRVAADEVRFFDRDRVDAAFARGAPLVENGAYKIHASRRDGPGEAELHVRDSDLIYVREGSATLVLGGRVVEGHEVADGEIRGRAIEGGSERPIGPGDVLTIPNGTPHWFREVRGPVLYYVVKVTAPEVQP